MDVLKKKIIEKIKKKGPITFEKFMEMALYEPGFGYYNSEKMRIGREGDFYTSSHLHPAFGAMIGRQIQEMWELMGEPDDFWIVEIGSGAGYVCMDMLEEMKESKFFDSINYNILEMNPAAMEKQMGLLSRFSHKVKWLNSMEQLNKIKGCIFSNELLDAFPVHLVQMQRELKEIYVNVENESLKEEKGPLSNEAIFEYFKENSVILKHGYRTEVNLRVRKWLKDISSLLEEGFVLSLDYGYSLREYYGEDRDRGTIMCYHRHQLSEDPFQNIGEQDITAHLNFSSLKKWGEEVGLKTIGYCGQGSFLVSLGIDEKIRKLVYSSPEYPFELARIKTLILPEGMGESHKVIVQYKGDKIFNLKGFSISNRIKSLA